MPETRKQEFVGIIKKCPNCGQILKSFQAKCPACGLELGGADAGKTNSVTEFFNKYSAETDIARQVALINAFPIPNTKADLYEFAMLAQQNIESYYRALERKTGYFSLMFSFMGNYYSLLFGGLFGRKKRTKENGMKDVVSAWEAKFEQVCARAVIIYAAGDEERAKITAMREELSQSILASQKRRRIKIGMTVGVIVFPILLMVIFDIWAFASVGSEPSAREREVTRLETLMTTIQTQISEGDYDSAELNLTELRWKYDPSYEPENVEEWNAKHDILQKRLEEKRKGGK